MVSIIMPAWNAEKTIVSSINSVISQTYKDWELIIVNDASTDSTAQLVCSIAKDEPRIRLYTNEKNMGIAGSRNFGIKQAKNEWIAFLDSDDSWCDTKLKKQLDFIAETSAKISYTGTAYVNETGARSDYVLYAKRELQYCDLLSANVMSCSSVMVLKDLMLRYPFPEGFLHEDYVVWLQILREIGCAYGLDQPLLMYRLSGSSISGNRIKSAKMTYFAYRKVGYNSLLSLLLTMRYALHSISKRSKIKVGW